MQQKMSMTKLELINWMIQLEKSHIDYQRNVIHKSLNLLNDLNKLKDLCQPPTPPTSPQNINDNNDNIDSDTAVVVVNENKKQRKPRTKVKPKLTVETILMDTL